MTEQSNSQLVREAYARWDACKGADLDMWDDYTTEDLCIRSLADGQYGVDFSCARDGRAEMRAYLEDLTGAFRMEHWTLKETIAQGNQVVGIGVTAWTNKASGRTVETPVVVVFGFRDGKVCEYREFYDTAAIAATVD